MLCLRFTYHSLFPAPCSVFAFMIRLTEKISNTEQGIMNTEYALPAIHLSFLVPCSLFSICIYDPTYRKNIEYGTRNHEYRICFACDSLIIPCSLLLVQYLHL